MNKPIVNNFSMSIATVNGSGSQSANMILARTFFRMGLPVGAKNLFPSNIAGLATWFSIRVNSEGYVGRQSLQDIFVAKNPDTLSNDLHQVKPDGFFFYDQDIKFDLNLLRKDTTNISIPFRELTKTTSDSVKMRKLLTNMIYVGVLSELLEVDADKLAASVQTQFNDKKNIVDLNIKTIDIGKKYAKEHISANLFHFKTKTILDGNQNSIFIDGNSAAALGAVCGGCTFFSWYPITPSSSLAESFKTYAHEVRKNHVDQNKYALVQAEDELSAINMAIGAGWAGSRSMTATSGPGLSLMAEAAGLSYFAEIPAVIWDVQRAGPSTGLPTRTMQSDVLPAAFLSHGDTEHVLLFPANPQECFEFAQLAHDIAEELQTLVIVLSDLDIGMNFFISNEFVLEHKKFSRGKVLDASMLNERDTFLRYQDTDGDGICYRTLPGTPHINAAFFTRGTGHTESSAYSEDEINYKNLLSRLKRKFENYKSKLPTPIIDRPNSDVGLLFYGSTDIIIPEAISLLSQKFETISTLRIRSFPFNHKVSSFLSDHKKIYVIEQNRDGQMAALLKIKFPEHGHKLRSILCFDGLPITAQFVADEILISHKSKTAERSIE